MAYVPKTLMTRIVDKLTEEQISKLAEETAQEILDIALLFRSVFNISSFLNILEYWVKIASYPYKHEVINGGQRHRLIVQHDMGKKYSFLMNELFRLVLDELMQKRTEFYITDNTGFL